MRLPSLMERYSDRRWAVTYGKELRVNVERAKARFSTWYELFPRSFASTPGAHGTLRDLWTVCLTSQEMGFDVLYLPPIHPVGNSFRKGKNNTLAAGATTSGAPGPSAPKKAATRPFIRSWDRWRISSAS